MITVRIDEETKRTMKQIRINWGELIRSSVKANIEEKRRNLAKALLLSERLREEECGRATR
ncbi:MAG: hypothetical protein QW394_06860 [Thermofilaceae archaeon]